MQRVSPSVHSSRKSAFLYESCTMKRLLSCVVAVVVICGAVGLAEEERKQSASESAAPAAENPSSCAPEEGDELGKRYTITCLEECLVLLNGNNHLFQISGYNIAFCTDRHEDFEWWQGDHPDPLPQDCLEGNCIGQRALKGMMVNNVKLPSKYAVNLDFHDMLPKPEQHKHKFKELEWTINKKDDGAIEVLSEQWIHVSKMGPGKDKELWAKLFVIKIDPMNAMMKAADEEKKKGNTKALESIQFVKQRPVRVGCLGFETDIINLVKDKQAKKLPEEATLIEIVYHESMWHDKHTLKLQATPKGRVFKVFTHTELVK